MSSIFGDNPKSCGHKDKMPSHSITFVTPDETEDFAFITGRLGLKNPEKVTSVRVCTECSDLLPSEVARREERDRSARLRREAESEEKEELVERIRGGETLHHCDSCDTDFPEDELAQVRECPHCETNFNGTENGRNCPDCNRPFSRKLADAGCPDCLEEAELEPTDLHDSMRAVIEDRSFEADGAPKTGKEIIAIAQGDDEIEQLYDLKVDESLVLSTAGAQDVTVHRRAAE